MSALTGRIRELGRWVSARLRGAHGQTGSDDDQGKAVWPVFGLVVSVLGLVGLALHLTHRATFDTPALVLAFIVLAPWLALFLDNATLPGGWRLEFRRLETTQRLQRAELDTIKFLLENTLTKWERSHLAALNSDEKFSYRWHKNFEAELTRLLALDFIDREPNKGFRPAKGDMRTDNDLRHHFHITGKGKDYLARLDEELQDSAPQLDRGDAASRPGSR